MRRYLVPVVLAALVVGPHAEPRMVSAESTSYCLRGTMSDGSYTRLRSVAVMPGVLRLGTKIELVGPRSRTFFGLRRFIVRDHIGHGSQLDFWAPRCSLSWRWGRRMVRYRIGWTR